LLETVEEKKIPQAARLPGFSWGMAPLLRITAARSVAVILELCGVVRDSGEKENSAGS